MHFPLEDLLSAQDLQQLQARLTNLDDSAWLPGAQTAGSYAKEGKNNWGGEREALLKNLINLDFTNYTAEKCP